MIGINIAGISIYIIQEIVSIRESRYQAETSSTVKGIEDADLYQEDGTWVPDPMNINMENHKGCHIWSSREDNG